MPRINEMWAWITSDGEPDNEGVTSMKIGESWFPMIGADRERMESLREYIASLAKLTGQPIRLVRFTTREELEVIEPE